MNQFIDALISAVPIFAVMLVGVLASAIWEKIDERRNAR